MTGRFDFKGVADAALAQAETLLSQWIGGRRNGHEWQAERTANGGLGDSLSVNLHTGAWLHGATNASGGDLVGLYAYRFNMPDMVAAAKAVAQAAGYELPAQQPEVWHANHPTNVSKHTQNHTAQGLRPAPADTGVDTSSSDAQAGDVKKDGREGNWLPILPVPSTALQPPRSHVKRGLPQAVYAYRNVAGELLGYVRRFATSDGGKATLPMTWCRHVDTGEMAWRDVGFPKPRPIYGAERLTPANPDGSYGRVVLLVEGEKCVDIARQDPVIDDKFDVVTWVGGCAGVKYVDWSPLAGRSVLAWPDCDAHTDKQTRCLLPQAEQPGELAMGVALAALSALGCKTYKLQTPVNGAVLAGWDIADAMEGGLNKDAAQALRGDALIDWMRERTQSWHAPAKTVSTPVPAGAGGVAASPDERMAAMEALYSKLVWGKGKVLVDCPQNVYYLCRLHPDLTGLVVFNEFASHIFKTRPAPWGGDAGIWTELDDRKLNIWALERMGLLVKSDSSVGRGVSMAADDERIHPVRQYLRSVVWDGAARIDTWLSIALGADPTPYHALVGALWLRGAVSRVMQPGNKFDYCPVLEGAQGLGKSTALKILFGDWFLDSPVKVGQPDGYIALRGKWGVEIQEMGAFNKAESTAVKQFITTPTDDYREPYGRRNVAIPRQCVFMGTTNDVEYFKDPTGSRRFWPVLCKTVNLQWLADNRDQLWAEAVLQFDAGLPLFPSRVQEKELFMPEQALRTAADMWAVSIEAWLELGGEGYAHDEVTTTLIWDKVIKEGLGRVSAGGAENRRIAQVLTDLGWAKRRNTTVVDGGTRGYHFRRPPRSVAVAQAGTNF